MASSSNPWIKASPWLLSLMRIIFAALYMQHGGNKLLHFPPGPLSLVPADKMLTLVPGLAGLLELGGGFLLLLGLFSRPIAFILSGEMAFAYFMAHYPANHIFPFLNGGDDAVMFCFAFLFLSAAGPGPFSIDRALRRV